MPEDDEPDEDEGPEPERTTELPSGVVLEEYEDGHVCVKQNEATAVSRVWVAPDDRDALAAFL